MPALPITYYRVVCGENAKKTHDIVSQRGTLRPLMMYDEFKRYLKEARISVKTLAVILGMNPTSITNYRGRGEVPRYLAVIATLLGAAASSSKPVTEVLSAYLREKR